MASTVIDDYKIFPRLMMLVVTVLTYQATHWFMNLPDPSNAQAGLVSVCMGALTGCFGIWMNKESKTDRSVQAPKPVAPAPVKDNR
tara:strand:+ start:586 stop:843 length:258 start_codon:yes stop_codon:yes gene_type:complete